MLTLVNGVQCYDTMVMEKEIKRAHGVVDEVDRRLSNQPARRSPSTKDCSCDRGDDIDTLSGSMSVCSLQHRYIAYQGSDPPVNCAGDHARLSRWEPAVDDREDDTRRT